MKSKIFILALLVQLAAVSCGNVNRKASTGITSDTTSSISTVLTDIDSTDMDSTLSKDPAAPYEPVYEIHTTEGTITVLLYNDTPLHRDNFAKLVSEHYYDSVLFHRVIYNFMIQTGDPLTRDSANKDRFGSGGPGYTIPAEFRPAHTHKKGALAAARTGDIANPRKESSGSQFYIVHNPETCVHLDGEYTVFGETIDGFDVIDRIASLKTDSMDRPLKDVRIITVTPVL